MGNLVADLTAIVGPAAVLQGPETEPNTVDHRGAWRGEAVAVVRPRTTDEVSAVVRAAADHGAVIVAQGGNTGLSGGSVPTETGPTVIVSLGRMATIESVHPDRFSATVEAGVTISAIHEAAAAADRLFAPDWGARGTATIGGAISTNAGGVNVLQFGTMRENVLGLEVVLPDGRVWDGMRALRKDSSGYDLKHLFIGAEGTLGIVTRAIVRLLPAYSHQQSAFAALPEIGAIRPLLDAALRRARGGVTAFELIPEKGVELVVSRYGRQRPLETMSEWYVLVRFAGSGPVTDTLSEFLEEAADQGHITDAVIASTPAQEENLWLVRDEITPGFIFDDHTAALKMDTAVPIDQIEAYIAQLTDLAADVFPGASHYAFGHVGDGNIHSYIVPPAGREDEFRTIKPEVRERTDKITWELGGTLSAEHGIGQELRDRIVGQMSDTEIDLARGLKRLFDPDSRLNPDKTLPPE